MKSKNCFDPILEKEPFEILTFFKNKFQLLNDLTINTVTTLPRDFLCLVKENSPLYNERISKIPRLRMLNKFLNHFDFHSKKIYILESEYNLRVLIHEILHVFSVYLIPENFERFKNSYGKKFYRDFFEGQTEFLTGLMLYLYYKDCYDIFRNPSYRYPEEENHLIGYAIPEWTKIWLSIAVHFNIQNVIDSYFYGNVNDFEDIRRKYLEGQFLYLFQLADKDMIHIKLDDRFKSHQNEIAGKQSLNYSLLDDQLRQMGLI